MKKITLLSLLFSMTLIVSAQSADEREVAAAVENLRKAMVDADKPALENIAAEELSYGHSNGLIQDKAAFVEAIASGKNDFKTIELSGQAITIAGNTAIVRHVFHAEVVNNGTPGTAHIGILLVWQKQKGKWKLLARQAVKL
jgi:ketosteroid isomerase-like protein